MTYKLISTGRSAHEVVPRRTGLIERGTALLMSLSSPVTIAVTYGRRKLEYWAFRTTFQLRASGGRKNWLEYSSS